MPRIILRQLLDHAAENSYAVPAFNMSNMEQGLAIMAAADKVGAPVIMRASRSARAYANDTVLAKLIDALVEIHPPGHARGSARRARAPSLDHPWRGAPGRRS